MNEAKSIIQKTLSSSPIPKKELENFINLFTENQIDKMQMIKWLKAVMKNGLTLSETADYTQILINSGKKIDFSYLPGFVVDKHSTGGVGDKVSFILGPILAACGCYVPMVAGRGLGHTGGTVDKLETIPGYNCKISLNEFVKIVESIGISIICQTKEICPADGKIYALRDVTNTVASNPLICGSIMSKKIAEGIKGLVLDIKTGNGAFMKSYEDAYNLGELLKSIGSRHKVSVYPAITDMSQPLGSNAGNWCEIVESVKSLQGEGPSDLMDIVYHLGEKALEMANIKNPYLKMKSAIDDGSALKKFRDMITAHGGDIEALDKSDLHKPQFKNSLIAKSDGFISFVDTLNLGNSLVELGAGRKKTSDIIDPSAGFTMHFKLGDYVKIGQKLLTYFCSSSEKMSKVKNIISKSIVISSEAPKLSKLILS